MVKRISSEEEYEEISFKVENLISSGPSPTSEAGRVISSLLDSLEEYDERIHPRIQGWICQLCNRSYNPAIAICTKCEENCAREPCTRKSATTQFQELLDVMILSDNNFRGKGC